jgi:hypothetical protein
MQLTFFKDTLKTTVVNKNHSKFDIYIGRGSIFGNPYRIGIDGNRAEVIHKYKLDFNNGKFLEEQLSTLKGKRLGCFCKPLACHGDVIAEYLNSL